MKLKTDFCRRCGFGKDPNDPWVFRVERPARCPRCGTAKWDEERTGKEPGPKPKVRIKP